MDLDGVLAVIPARFGSSRFPGKPLATILGKALILRVAERVEQALPRAAVVVATDDERIATVVEAAGHRVRMTPSDCLTGTDRVWHAVKDLDFRVILNVQGDEPLIESGDLLSVLAASQECPGHVVNAMCLIESEADVLSRNVPKVVTTDRGRMVYMSRSPVPSTKSGIAGGPFFRQVCIYAFNRAQLEAYSRFGGRSALESREDIEILRFLELGIPVTMVEVAGQSVAVDVPEDVGRVEALLSE